MEEQRKTDSLTELVVLANESHQRMVALVDRAEAIEGIQRGLASMERGEGRPVSEVFEDIRQRHGIPREVRAAARNNHPNYLGRLS